MKRYVHVLQSKNAPRCFYTGITSDLRERLFAHNAGKCKYTAHKRPWRVIVTIRFADEEHALNFERYLKSGSGAAFARRHSDDVVDRGQWTHASCVRGQVACQP
jgi:predicted GIY-YIG superfamily endonuclease